MRYIKVFLLVLLFFIVMMLFVQNQASFSDAVTLKFDPMFLPAVTSAPIPRYALLLICFVLGAAVVLAMLLWDRLTLTSRLAGARHRGNSLQKKLEEANARIAELENKLQDAGEKGKTASAE